jgi:transcriptional regulator with XRE-family HTH domain
MTTSVALRGYGSELGFAIQSDPGGTARNQTILPAYPIGTGGAATKRHVVAIWRAITAPFEAPPADVSVRSAAEQLEFIRHCLSLSVSDLARIVGVQRPTIYAWLQNGAPRRGESLERLAMLERTAAHWKAIADRPIGALARLAIGMKGETFVSLLESASEEDLHVALEQLGARLRKRAPSIKDVLHTYGLPDASEPELAEGRRRAIRRRATHRPR